MNSKSMEAAKIMYKDNMTHKGSSNIDEYDAIMKDLDVLEAIKNAHIKFDTTYECISIWFNNTKDFLKVYRSLHDKN